MEEAGATQVGMRVMLETLEFKHSTLGLKGLLNLGKDSYSVCNDATASPGMQSIPVSKTDHSNSAGEICAYNIDKG